ncbi:hypothetical protein BGZ63DRAFT_414462 [Mariannaea sp. PMI_226]|nr:hypothetical protein BGZ63DRAFT_414462 [Mariannaea sp. PMI_226]
MDLGIGLEDTVVAITGAGGQIGQVIVDAFLSAGCYVGAFDIKFHSPKQHDRLLFVSVDTTDEEAMGKAWNTVKDRFHAFPTVCVCAAALDLSFIEHHRSITNMSSEQFRRTMEVNVVGTFITARLWLSHIEKGLRGRAAHQEGIDNIECPDRKFRADELKNISLIIIGSEAGTLGVPGNPDYAASKSAVQQGLMLSLAPDAARVHPRARVNAICPGAVDTARFQEECAEDPSGSVRWVDAEATVASRVPVQKEDIARLCLVLASERWSASTTGQALRVDGGKSGRLLWSKSGNATWG